jgi:diguanylate cyclase (GGDEF)-like protein
MIAIVVAVCCAGWLLTLCHGRRLRRRIDELIWSAGHDELTTLYNRTGLLDRYRAMADWPVAVMVLQMDLDGFKQVNDRLGHGAGDDVIREVAGRVDEVAENFGGFAARLSGDEYVAVIEWRGHDIDRVAALFSRFIAQPVTVTGSGGQEVTLTPTVSVGAAWADSRDPLFEMALRRADVAMYHAKRDGGDRYVVYQPGMVMPLTPASLPAAGPHGQPIVSAIRIGTRTDPAEFVVLLDCRDSSHGDRYATMKVMVGADGNTVFSHGTFTMAHRHAMANLAERAGLFPRRDIEVVVLAAEPHARDKVAVFIDGTPAEATSTIRVRAEVFRLNLNPSALDDHQRVARDLIRARTWSPAAGGFLAARLNQFFAAHRSEAAGGNT